VYTTNSDGSIWYLYHSVSTVGAEPAWRITKGVKSTDGGLLTKTEPVGTVITKFPVGNYVWFGLDLSTYSQKPVPVNITCGESPSPTATCSDFGMIVAEVSGNPAPTAEVLNFNGATWEVNASIVKTHNRPVFQLVLNRDQEIDKVYYMYYTENLNAGGNYDAGHWRVAFDPTLPTTGGLLCVADAAQQPVDIRGSWQASTDTFSYTGISVSTNCLDVPGGSGECAALELETANVPGKGDLDGDWELAGNTADGRPYFTHLGDSTGKPWFLYWTNDPDGVGPARWCIWEELEVYTSYIFQDSVSTEPQMLPAQWAAFNMETQVEEPCQIEIYCTKADNATIDPSTRRPIAEAGDTAAVLVSLSVIGIVCGAVYWYKYKRNGDQYNTKYNTISAGAGGHIPLL
jgi:hypothetical protein